MSASMVPLTMVVHRGPARRRARTLTRLGIAFCSSIGILLSQIPLRQHRNGTFVPMQIGSRASGRIVQDANSRLARGASAVGVLPSIKLYQFESCPFCSKVRAYCDYNGVKIDRVEVNPVTKSEIWGVAGDYRKVPIADIDDTIVVGSAEIIRAVAQKIGKDSEHDAGWSNWVDSTLAKVLPPNVYRTPSEALQTSGMVAAKGQFDFWGAATAKYVGGAVMFVVSKMMAKKAGIVAGGERDALYDACSQWTAAVAERPFLGGESPSMADLEVYGVLSSIAGTDAHDDMLANTSIGGWYDRMEKACRRA
eukprot:TRINITY_DN63276_c0_g1_i1.p1 TRINITY_DN63276_c0_g1~~TRINITY_DN63276_c0_g1_i1.p1  ORF type:complete len:308 (-),score=57.59 TRINITY_DN63276_c0_g1_i1:367-1290(-)